MPQMTGHAQRPQSAADGGLPVQWEGLGQRLDVHRGAVGEVVHVTGDIPLPLRECHEVVKV